ncbi:flavin reductase [Sphingomonas koreensis]
MIDPAIFRDAMSRLGAAVNLITSDGPAGRHGMTASAVCSVTDSPPTILVCVNRASPANEKFRANGSLCVNVLAPRHQALSGRFADRTLSLEERFRDEGLWTALATGSPVLRDACVALDCRISHISEIGTHSVFFCEVHDVLLHGDKGALIYFDRAYHGLAALTGMTV